MTKLAAACGFAASLQGAIFMQTFDDASSIDPWALVADASNPSEASKGWLETGGNPGGALEISGIHGGGGAGRAFIFEMSVPVAFNGLSEATLQFDVKITEPLVGTAVHYSVNQTGPGGSNFVNIFDIQGQLNTSTFSTITYEITNIPATADTFILAINIAAGAFEGAGGALAIDNITVIPEPSTYAALFGLLAVGFVIVRRRRRKV